MAMLIAGAITTTIAFTIHVAVVDEARGSLFSD
jgi:hypothetical protein